MTLIYDKQVFRDVPGRPQIYASASGRVISTRPVNGQPGISPARELKYKLDRFGYLSVTLSGRRFHHPASLKIHHAVLGAWVRPKHSGEIARHLDGNKLNNYFLNLAWGTYKQNGQDNVLHGTHKGEKNGRSLMTPSDVMELRSQYISKPLSALLVDHPQWSKFAIWAAVSGYTWNHLPGSIPKKRTCSKESWKASKGL